MSPVLTRKEEKVMGEERLRNTVFFNFKYHEK